RGGPLRAAVAVVVAGHHSPHGAVPTSETAYQRGVRTGPASQRPPFQAFSNSAFPAPNTARSPWSVWYSEVPGAMRASPILARRSSGAVFPLPLARKAIAEVLSS